MTKKVEAKVLIADSSSHFMATWSRGVGSWKVFTSWLKLNQKRQVF